MECIPNFVSKLLALSNFKALEGNSLSTKPDHKIKLNVMIVCNGFSLLFFPTSFSYIKY